MKWFVKRALAVLALSGAAYAQARSTETDFLQNASRALSRSYANKGVSYILLEISTGRHIESGWSSSKKAIPIGSLVKPFTALAYAESNNFRFPELTCAGGNACWNPAGHGKLDIVRAIALSCNSYFTQLAAHVGASDVESLARRYGLSGPEFTASPGGLAGRYGEWRESPFALVHAYAEFVSRAAQPGIRDIVRGMRESAVSGTAEGASRAVPNLALLTKTGTAPCTHHARAPGDGFTVVAWPADTPHYVLLLRVHSVPGAQAAILAGKMVRSLESQP